MSGTRMIRNAVVAAVLFGAVAMPVLADIGPVQMIHESTERFYSGGGTEILGCSGQACPGKLPYNVGDVSGTLLWEIIEKAFYLRRDTAVPVQTKITYTVGNDALFNTPIASFGVMNNGIQADSWTMADGWNFYQDNMAWYWWTDDPTKTIGVTTTLNSFSVIFDRELRIGWAQAGYDYLSSDGGQILGAQLSGHEVVTSPNWVASSVVPAPGAVVLGAIGLATIGWVRRRLN